MSPSEPKTKRREPHEGPTAQADDSQAPANGNNKDTPLAAKTHSIRRDLLVGILLPALLFVAYNTYSLYRESLHAINTAYDRSLLASAKVIGEQLDVQGYDDSAIIDSTVPYSALEAFEAETRSRMFYRVSNMHGELISGFAEVPLWRGTIAAQPPYAALVDFYNAEFRERPVRIAALLQPVASARGRGMALVQVAETLEIRETLARQILWTTLLKQALLCMSLALIVFWVVRRSTRPILQLSDQVHARDADDLSPLQIPPSTPQEVRPLIDATNQVMQRLAQQLQHQRRFVRDASHQLRTPLAVLKAQVQSAQRGDVEAHQAFTEIEHTVNRATRLANQMLALAKVEQQRLTAPKHVHNVADIVRDLVIDLSPLIAQKNLDFSLEASDIYAQADDWMLRELIRNLLHNAVKFSPPDGRLHVDLRQIVDPEPRGQLSIQDAGPGISDEFRTRLFQPFTTMDSSNGTGLGLAICQEIATALHGTLNLQNRVAQGITEGLNAEFRFPTTMAASSNSDPHANI